MICKQCGNQINDTGSFCPFCGAPVAQAQPQPQPQPQTPPQQPVYQAPQEDYTKLGGFLQVVVLLLKIIGPVILGIALVIGTITNIVSLVRYIQYSLGLSYIIRIIIVLILNIIDSGFGIFVLVSTGMKLEKKNPDFLKFYQMFLPIQVLIGLIAQLIGTYSIVTVFSTVIPSLIVSVVVFVLWNLYFAKSYRVYAYMGSDEYLRNSLFCKNVPAPVKPQQAQVYPQQAYTPPQQPYSQPQAQQQAYAQPQPQPQPEAAPAQAPENPSSKEE